MINFVVITDTPGRLAQFLEARGIIQQVPGPGGVGTQWQGVRGGMEWVKVPNPIITDPGSGTFGQPGYVPPTYDDRSVFLVKFAHESEVNEGADTSPESDKTQNIYDWSKFGTWVKNNSTVVTAPANFTINGVPVGDAYKINGQPVWLVRDNPERFGVWQ